LVAAGEWTLEQIADQVGVGRRTLFDWRRRPEFRARVEELLAEYRQTLAERNRQRVCR
jgi:hypothetical protein